MVRTPQVQVTDPLSSCNAMHFIVLPLMQKLDDEDDDDNDDDAIPLYSQRVSGGQNDNGDFRSAVLSRFIFFRWMGMLLADEFLESTAKAGPLLDDVVESVAWTGSAVCVAVTVQRIFRVDLARFDAAGNKVLGRVEHRSVGRRLHEVTDERDGDAVVVVASGVSSYSTPATGLVDAPITAHEEIVADVCPAVLVHVVVLVAADEPAACGLVLALGPRGVVYEHVLGSGVLHGLPISRSPGAPAAAAHDIHARTSLGSDCRSLQNSSKRRKREQALGSPHVTALEESQHSLRRSQRLVQQASTSPTSSAIVYARGMQHDNPPGPEPTLRHVTVFSQLLCRGATSVDHGSCMPRRNATRLGFRLEELLRVGAPIIRLHPNCAPACIAYPCLPPLKWPTMQLFTEQRVSTKDTSIVHTETLARMTVHSAI